MTAFSQMHLLRYSIVIKRERSAINIVGTGEWIGMAVECVTFCIEHHRTPNHGQHSFGFSGHVGFPKLQRPTIVVLPIFIEKENQVHPPPRAQVRMHVKIGMNAKMSALGSKLPPENRTLTSATICCLLIFDKKEIRDVETEAAFA